LLHFVCPAPRVEYVILESALLLKMPQACETLKPTLSALLGEFLALSQGQLRSKDSCMRKKLMKFSSIFFEKRGFYILVIFFNFKPALSLMIFDILGFSLER
jgi:hypothetical protein